MNVKAEPLVPKVFISYNWTDVAHKERVREWADRLFGDGVNVIIDIYDLRPGDDKIVFMEKMVQDPTITHVLLVCDQSYVEKADARQAGVGIEALIVSQEVYKKTAQSKFVSIFCEFNDDGEPYLPTFIASRIGFNFTSPEKVNETWEDLVRFLNGQPRFTKPALGKKPAYLTQNTTLPTSGVTAKIRSLENGLKQGKTTVPLLREDFFDACVSYVDELRIREEPNVDDWGQRIISDYEKLKPIRNFLVDWLLLESTLRGNEEDFSETLIDLLERVLALRFRTEEVTRFNDKWWTAHSLFVYEVFLYFVAVLIKTKSFSTLNVIFETKYILPPSERHTGTDYGSFAKFHASAGDDLNNSLSNGEPNCHSPAAKLIKRHSDRTDLPFKDIMQADLLVLLVSQLRDIRWYPQTLYYVDFYPNFEFFVRAAQRKNFKKLAIITEVKSGDALREKLKTTEISSGRGWHPLTIDFAQALNLEKLDTV